MSPVERRAYIENVAAQEAAYWYCRQHGIRADDFVIGQILQVAAPIILQGAVDLVREALNEVRQIGHTPDAYGLTGEAETKLMAALAALGGSRP